ncbi:MAG: portal protein [Vibrio splendidus]
MEKDKQYSASISQLSKFQAADKDCRDKAREQDAFVIDPDGQWEPNVARKLDGAKRPRYTFDFTSSAIEILMGDIEDMDFAVNVKPNGGGADKELAELREGMIRTIENMSNATSTYRNAARRIMRRGFDAWMVRSKYADDFAFEQDLTVEPIANAINRVYTSDDGIKPDNSDSSCTFVLEALSLSDYKEKYPKGSKISVDDNSDDIRFDDNQREVIVVAHKFYRKYTKKQVGLLSNGDVIVIDENFVKIADEMTQMGISLVKTKEAKVPKFYHRIMDGGGWLSDERETPFSSNPIVTVYGNYEITGKTSEKRYSGIVEKMMDFNRVFNYAKSREIEEGALAPKDFFWATKENAKGHTEKWARMNTSSDPVQFYNPDEENGAIPPQRAGGAQINPHLNQLSADMQMGIQSASNINNAMNGQQAGRMSEEALRMQIDRGTGATRKWVNSLVLGIRRTGELLLEAMPYVYDTKRQYTITNMDGTTEDTMLNDEVYDRQSGQMVRLNTLNKGKYAVFCDAGPAFSNKLEAGLRAMLEYAALDPSIVQQGGDVMLNAIDAPLVDVIANRKRQMMLQQGLIPFSEMTEEEQAEAQARAQQPKQPSPEEMIGQAELQKAQVQATDAETDRIEAQIKMYDAETKRLAAVATAQEKGVKIDNIRADTMKKRTEMVGTILGGQGR